MAKYRIKNWSSFQHYKDRNPPWIKLHFALLSSADWVTLDDQSRVLAIACMLVASKNEGVSDGSDRGLSYLEGVAYLTSRPDLNPLIDSGFLVLLADASACKQKQAKDTQEEEAEGEKEKRKRDTEYPNRTAGRDLVPDLSTSEKKSKQTPSQMIQAMAHERDQVEELHHRYGRPPWTPDQISAAKSWLKPLKKYTEAQLDLRRRNNASKRGNGDFEGIGSALAGMIGGQS